MLEYNALVERVRGTGNRGTELHQYIEKTTNHYVDQDYELTAVCMRNVLTIIMEEILLCNGHEVNPRDIKLVDKIQLAKGYMPSIIYEASYQLRKLGNNGAHAEAISKSECEQVIPDFKRVINWYIVGDLNGDDVFTAYEQESRMNVKLKDDQLMVMVNNTGTLELMKAYGNGMGFLQRTQEESIKQFKERIAMHPRVCFGKARLWSQLLLETSMVPLEIDWYDPDYNQEDLRFYIDFEGVVDQSIFTSPTYFEVTGKYTMGSNNSVVPNYDTLVMKIGSSDYKVRALSLNKSMFEKQEEFIKRAKCLSQMPVAILTLDSNKCDKTCGFYVGELLPLPGSCIRELEEERFYFHSDEEVDTSREILVYGTLLPIAEQLVCKQLNVKVSNQRIKIFSQIYDAEFINSIGMVPVGTYETIAESSDSSIGFIHLQVVMDNSFLKHLGERKAYFIIDETKRALFKGLGKVYGRLVLKDNEIVCHELYISHGGKWMKCYGAQGEGITKDDLMSLIGKRFPIGFFEYVENGFDRITGYCPFDMVEQLTWLRIKPFTENEFYIYKNTKGNPVTGSKNYVYAHLAIEENVLLFNQVTVNIGGEYYTVYLRKLSKLQHETVGAYKARLQGKLPIGIGKIDLNSVDLDRGSAQLVIKRDNWYEGVIPIQKDIFALADLRGDKTELLKQGIHTIFSMQSEASNGQLVPNENNLRLHINDLQVELLVINLDDGFDALEREYLNKLERITAGVIDVVSKRYDAETELFSVQINWLPWCEQVTSALKEGWISIPPKQAKELFESDIAYSVYLILSNEGIIEVRLLVEEEYILGFEALGNKPQPRDVQPILIEEQIDDEVRGQDLVETIGDGGIVVAEGVHHEVFDAVNMNAYIFEQEESVIDVIPQEQQEEATIESVQVNSHTTSNRKEHAKSNNRKKWMTLALGVGIGIILLFGIYSYAQGSKDKGAAEILSAPLSEEREQVADIEDIVNHEEGLLENQNAQEVNEEQQGEVEQIASGSDVEKDITLTEESEQIASKEESITLQEDVMPQGVTDSQGTTPQQQSTENNKDKNTTTNATTNTTTEKAKSKETVNKYPAPADIASYKKVAFRNEIGAYKPNTELIKAIDVKSIQYKEDGDNIILLVEYELYANVQMSGVVRSPNLYKVKEEGYWYLEDGSGYRTVTVPKEKIQGVPDFHFEFSDNKVYQYSWIDGGELTRILNECNPIKDNSKSNSPASVNIPFTLEEGNNEGMGITSITAKRFNDKVQFNIGYYNNSEMHIMIVLDGENQSTYDTTLSKPTSSGTVGFTINMEEVKKGKKHKIEIWDKESTKGEIYVFTVESLSKVFE